MKTTLKKLEMKGIRSFVEPASIDLPDSGLLLFMGPSGSGKSTVFLSIAHALGYCPYSGTELQSWLGDQKLEVKLTLGTEAGNSTIVRGPKSFIEGVESVVGASNLTPAIHRLTGLSTELLSALTYRPQGSAGLFLSKTNSEMQEFLSVLLDLNKFDSAVEVTQKKVEDLKVHRDCAWEILPVYKEKFERACAVILPNLKDEKEFVRLIAESKAVLERAKLAHDKMGEEITAEKQKWTKQQLEFRKRIEQESKLHPSPVEVTTTPEIERLSKLKAQAYDRVGKLEIADKARLSEIKLKISELHDEVGNLGAHLKRRSEWETEKKVRELELQKLEGAICPRCEQEWKTDKVEADIWKTKKRISELTTSISQMSSVQEKQTALQAEIHSLNQSLVPDPLIAKMVEIYNDAKNKLMVELAELRAANQKAVSDWKAEVAQAVAGIGEEEMRAARVAMAEQEARNKVYIALSEEAAKARSAVLEAEGNLKTTKKENEYLHKEELRLAEERTAAREAYEKGQSALELAEKALREEQDLLEMLKAFLTAIYDEVLEEIAYSTNQMLARVPNVSHVTIKFKSESTTQKGTTKRAIVPVVNLGGGDRPLRSALSGGMMSAVELAVDLAVRRVISARSGAIPGWLVLDECFDGLGVADKESCLELLKQAAQDTLILVIDHSSETKELFSSVVEIENANGRSRIV